MAERTPVDVEHLIRQAVGLRRLAVRLVGESDADDVLQEAITAGIGRAPSEPTSLRNWLVRVVRNIATSRHRTGTHRTEREMRAAAPESTHSTASLVERMEVQRVVAEEVLRLDEPYRTAVLAVYFDGASAEDYARELGVPSATVRSWLKRGLESLRVRLDRRFGGHREAWSALLVPLARTDVATVAATGGLVAKKIAALSLVLIALVLLVRLATDDAGEGAFASIPEPEFVDADLAAPSEIASPDVASVEDPAARVAALDPVASAPRSGAVAGIAVWPDDSPAFDVGVRLAPERHEPSGRDPAQHVTARDGAFHFDDVRPGRYTVRVDRSTLKVPIEVAAGETTRARVELPAGTTVRGRVLDADGSPYAGADIWLKEPDSGWLSRIAVSAPDGSYSIVGVGRGTEWHARAPGRFASGAHSWSEGVDGVHAVDLHLVDAVGAIRGRVIDAAREPVAGAVVKFGGRQGGGLDPSGVHVRAALARPVITDAQGAFETFDAPLGSVRVTVISAELPSTSASVEVRPDVASVIELAVGAAARVRGRAYAPDGSPLANVVVTVRSAATSSSSLDITAADGRYEIANAPAGPVRIVARHDRRRENPLQAEISAEVELIAGSDFEWDARFGAPASIRGRLIDTNGAPLASAEVTASPGSLRARTDEAGRFEFAAVPARAHVLRHDGDGRRAQSPPVLPGDGDVVLTAQWANARVTGRLVRHDGTASAGTQVGCAGMWSSTKADGSFELENVLAGEQDVVVAELVFDPTPRVIANVRVSPGGVHELGAIEVPGVGGLRVRVRSTAGVPLQFVTPSLSDSASGARYGPKSDRGPNGEWTFESVPAGEYRLALSGGAAAANPQHVVVVADQLAEAEIDARFGIRFEVELRAVAGGAALEEPRLDVHAADRALVDTYVDTRRGVPSAGAKFDVCLAPGRYELRARSRDGRAAASPIDVVEGRSRVVLELR